MNKNSSPVVILFVPPLYDTTIGLSSLEFEMATCLTPSQSAAAIFVPPTQPTTTTSINYQAKPTEPNWEEADAVLRSMLAPISEEDEISPTEAAEIFSSVLVEHLKCLGQIRNGSKEIHRERAIMKTCRVLTKEKNRLRRKFVTPSGHREFLDAVRVHNKAQSCAKWLSSSQSSRRQEAAFRRNPQQTKTEEGKELGQGLKSKGEKDDELTAYSP